MSMALTGLNVFLEQTSTSTLRRLWVGCSRFGIDLPNISNLATRQRQLLAHCRSAPPAQPGQAEIAIQGDSPQRINPALAKTLVWSGPRRRR